MTGMAGESISAGGSSVTCTVLRMLAIAPPPKLRPILAQQLEALTTMLTLRNHSSNKATQLAQQCTGSAGLLRSGTAAYTARGGVRAALAAAEAVVPEAKRGGMTIMINTVSMTRVGLAASVYHTRAVFPRCFSLCFFCPHRYPRTAGFVCIAEGRGGAPSDDVCAGNGLLDPGWCSGRTGSAGHEGMEP
jgi:hypothetical protein